MTETNEIEFLEPVGSSGGPAGNGRSLPVRIGIVAGSALVVLVGAVAAMGASPAPSTAADPGASAAPGTTQPAPDGDDKVRGIGERGGFGRGGFRDITISSISGSNLSLATDDGWTRTIAVTSATTITKGGATVTVADLAAGDQIRFGQTRAADGTYTIDAIHVVLPRIAGQVSAIDGNDVTVTQKDGTTATIHVDASTTYRVEGVTTPTLSDIKVGAFLVAEGTLRADGSLDASAVGSGLRGRDGHGPKVDDDDADDVPPSASPSASPG